MLEIICSGISLDLFPDTEISYHLENPFVSADRIPIPYTLDFDLPATVKNLSVFGFADRVTSRAIFEVKMPVEVRFSGFVVISGTLNLQQVFPKDRIVVNVTGAVLPPSVDKKLYKQSLGELVFEFDYKTDSKGSQAIDTSTTKVAINDRLTAEAEKEMPDFVVAPCAIKGVTAQFFEETNPDFYVDKYTNQRNGMINNYRYELGIFPGQHTVSYSGYYSTSLNGEKVMSKIIPAFRVGYLLKKILNVTFSNNVFDKELGNLMLLCNYHPSYQADDNSLVGTVDEENKVIRMRFADYMPDVEVNEFLTEILKLPCLTLFAKGSRYDIEFNSDILSSKISDLIKILDGYSITIEKGSQYDFSVAAAESSGASTEGVYTYNYSKVNDLFRDISFFPYTKNNDSRWRLGVKETMQTFEASAVNELTEAYLYNMQLKYRVHWSLRLMSQGSIKSTALEEQEEEEDEREVFDMSFKGSMCSTVVTTYLDDDDSYRPQFDGNVDSHLRLYIPEIALEKKDGKLSRSNKLTIGLYHGLRPGILNEQRKGITCPQISHTNVLVDGTKVSDITLDDDTLINKYHSDYKSWVEKDKRVITGSVMLTPIELHRLDLRRKRHFAGRDFLIRTIDGILTNNRIEPFDIELIEV